MRESRSLSNEEPSLSSSQEEPKYHNRLSDVSLPHSQAQTSTSPSTHSGAVNKMSHQSSEERLSNMYRNEGFPSISSTYSEQVIVFYPSTANPLTSKSLCSSENHDLYLLQDFT